MSTFYPARADYNAGIISVDQALNNPTVIEARVAEIAEKHLIVDNIFTPGGEVSGGAVIYSPVTEKHLFTENDVADRQPGDEYPVLYSARPESQLARVQDFGGKFAVSDEARRRNNSIDFDNDVTRLANTISRKINTRAVETLQAAITGGDVVEIQAAAGWDDVVLDGAPTSITAPKNRPTADIANAIAEVEARDLGVTYQRMLVNPLTLANLRIAYGASLGTMLDDFGLELFSSVHVPATSAFLVDHRQAGFVRYEESLTIATWRDEEHRQTWTQGYAMPVMGVTLPAAVAVITGVDASAAPAA